MQLTETEEEAISSLQQVVRRWPKSLWLFSASGTLWVMRKKAGERAALPNEAMDPDYCVTAVEIENDGGDW